MERFPKSPGTSPHVPSVSFSAFEKMFAEKRAFFITLCEVTNPETEEDTKEIDCEKCGGNKYVRTGKKTPSGQGYILKTCPRCGGTGKEKA